MDEKERHSAFMSALVTEHLVLQAAASATVSEAAARASLYVYSLSSCLVAMGFASRSSEVFRPFAAAVLPAVFILGIFTIARLVDTGMEYQQALRGIARIRGYYRTITPEAATYFSADNGRWPEKRSAPRFWSGAFVALLTTAASMIAFTNSVVAGACVVLLVAGLVGSDRIGLALSLGAAAAVALMALFIAYQRRRYRSF
jgi:hypothetical protein